MATDESIQHSVSEASVPRVRTPIVTHSAVQHWLLRIALLSVDAAALGAAIALAYVVRFKLGIPLLATPGHTVAYYSSVAYWTVPVWLAIFALYHLYDRQYLFTGFHEYTRVVNACTAGMLVRSQAIYGTPEHIGAT